ncbi:MAG: type II toxin-antitoxin system VapC family toxin [Salinivirgaceae bacterium]|jgi:PIN domain nuclease of toxin-antitoxin system
MRYLLDTHAFLWFIAGSNDLSQNAKSIIINPDNEKYVSIASFWEISIKLKVDKIELDIPFKELKNQAKINGFKILPIVFDDTQRLLTLDLHHRDPFDRIIISQAIKHKMSIITKDPEFKKYTSKIIW